MDALTILVLVACSKDNVPSQAASDDSSTSDSDSAIGKDDSGTIVDADDDGWNAADDCDDGDSLVHPEATEHCLDDIDDDCDGTVDSCALCTSDVTSDSYEWLGAVAAVEVLETSNDATTWMLGTADDPKRSDFLMGGQGGSWSSGFTFLEQEWPTTLAASDLDLDQTDDLVIGGHRSDSGEAVAWVFYSPVSGQGLMSVAADATLVGPSESLIATTTSLSKISAQAEPTDGLFFVGTLESWIVMGPLSGTLEMLSTPGAVSVADHPLSASSSDFDGDGLNDLFLGGADAVETKSPYDRALRVFLAPVFDPLIDSASQYTWTDGNAGTILVTGDFSGDGRSDAIATGAQFSDEAVPLYLLTDASPDGQVSSVAVATITSAAPWDPPSIDATDFNADGMDDLVVAQPTAYGAPSAGMVSLIMGPFEGAVSIADDANASVSSCTKGSSEQLGTVVTVGDADLDRAPDVVVGSVIWSQGFGSPFKGGVRVMPATLFFE